MRRIRVRRGSLGTLLLAAGGFALGGGTAEATFRLHEAAGPPVGVGRTALSALSETGAAASATGSDEGSDPGSDPTGDGEEGLPARAALGVDEGPSTTATSTTTATATSSTRVPHPAPRRTATARRTVVPTVAPKAAPRRTTAPTRKATPSRTTAGPAPRTSVARPPAVGSTGS